MKAADARAFGPRCAADGGFKPGETPRRLNACGLLRSVDVPEIEVIAVEVPDPEGPCGAKGIGEIACIPTAPAVVNALYLVDGVRRRELPVGRKK